MAQLQRHHIKAVTLGTSTVLAALNTGDGQAHLFFTKDSQLSPIMAENLLAGAEIRSVGDAPWLTGPRPADQDTNLCRQQAGRNPA